MGMPPHVSLTPNGIDWGAAPFDPIDLSPGTWWRYHDNSFSDAGTAPAVEDAAIQQSNDLSGNNRNVTQATLEKRPLYKTNIINGKAVARFDATDDSMTGLFTTAAARTVFIVAVKRGAVDASVRGLITQAVATSLVYAHNGGGGGLRYSRNEAGAEVTLGGTPTSPFILELVYASLSSVVPVINGTAGAAFDPNDGYDNTATVHLASDSGVASFGDFDIAEVIYYPTELSSGNRTSVRQYLATYYGITIA